MPASDADVASAFDRVCAALGRSTGATLGRALSKPALMLDGKIVAFATRGRLVVKLPPDERAALVAAGRAEPMRMGARVMREWVALAPSTTAAWIAAAEASARYVASLPAPVKRRKR